MFDNLLIVHNPKSKAGKYYVVLNEKDNEDVLIINKVRVQGECIAIANSDSEAKQICKNLTYN